jgi:hypothetical protein
MRQTHPLNSQEAAIDAVMRRERRTDSRCDSALNLFRLAVRFPAGRSDRLERVADEMLGVPHDLHQ